MSQHRGAAFSYLIVPAGPADAEALARVHVTSWRETYRDLLPEAFLARMSEPGHARRFRHELTRPGPHDVLLAAINPYGVFGYVAGGPSRAGVEGEAEIATLYILRSAQGRGVGRRLLTDAARTLAAHGARSLMISVLAENAPARGFYERLGGVAGEPRHEAGFGGKVWEVTYRWPEIGRLTG
ncbi:GNAT family N-acetyltransferase [Phenylobacterium sp. LjRoot219]|uniref:GNAT family N-acetyltransferase n=1 Tax=Phenylobacterium sp. LjRoot219 TaxID=3342283 RepID=UPI003ECD9005